MPPLRVLAAAVALSAALPILSGPASAQDWGQLAAPDVVEILTTDADGGTRTTKIWIVLLDGHAYIRTGGTRWVGNLEREPLATLRSGEAEQPVRVEFVSDEDLRDRVGQAFREKYGFSDRMARLMRFGRVRIMRLESRPGT